MARCATACQPYAATDADGDGEDTSCFPNTQAGMVFGIGVRRREIDTVLTPMRDSNLTHRGTDSSILLTTRSADAL